MCNFVLSCLIFFRIVLSLLVLSITYNQWQKLWEKLIFGQFFVSAPFPLSLTMLRLNEQNFGQAMLRTLCWGRGGILKPISMRYTNVDLKVSLYVCVHMKTIPWKFRILNPKNFVDFLKSRLTFNIFFCFWIFVDKLSHISRAHISKSKPCFNVKSSTYYFHIRPRYWQILKSALVYL